MQNLTPTPWLNTHPTHPLLSIESAIAVRLAPLQDSDLTTGITSMVTLGVGFIQGGGEVWSIAGILILIFMAAIWTSTIAEACVSSVVSWDVEFRQGYGNPQSAAVSVVTLNRINQSTRHKAILENYIHQEPARTMVCAEYSVATA
jgi:hypothetical protein